MTVKLFYDQPPRKYETELAILILRFGVKYNFHGVIIMWLTSISSIIDTLIQRFFGDIADSSRVHVRLYI